MHYYYYPWYGSWVGTIFWIIVIVLLVWALSAAFNHHPHQYGPPPQQDKNAALGTLNQRYAKGEINKEEYEQKKKDILAS